jgi:Flp pilus assembly secretin CpaC
LRAKLAELDRLTDEVQRLRAATQTAHSIFVNVEVLEVSLTKMRALGMGLSPTEGSGVQMSGEAAGELIKMLKENNVGRTLACPSLVMVSGRPASFFVGSQIPIPSPADGEKPVDYVQAGVGLDVTADSLGANRVRLRVKPRISAASERTAAGDEQPAIPKLKVWQCDASCEMEFGQTFILPSQIERRVEARREDSGRVVETTIDVARWVVVHVEDASNAKVAQRLSAAEPTVSNSGPYTSRPVNR